ncbi:MAG TPA: glycoside hydrolase family 30 beta sandwich domain-containing protein [Phnomibacter sp.]|nr:glycoside hydrolase family 30 beta sandwich domain-containing protein [Phnomibacter sp.]
MNRRMLFTMASVVLCLSCSCGKGKDGGTPEPLTGTVEQWFTNAAQTQLLQKQTNMLAFGTVNPGGISIEIEEGTTFQSIDGYGYTLTGGSAMLIKAMGNTERANLLNELFGKNENAIGVSYLRLSMGASDLNPFVYSYNDLPAGQTDVSLSQFSLAADTVDVIPVLKEILAISPNMKLMASPWSAPAWMKTNGSTIGGSLLPAYYSVYAQYFVKYIQAMKDRGITIDAVTVQNEPQHGGNNPSMLMTAQEQATFIKGHLGPAFQAAGIQTKIVIWDHNCDNPNYPITILNDAAAKAFINGTAFHLYAGDITALSQVKNAHPDRDIYFTEQWTGSNGSFSGDLMWHIQNVMIGSMRNWAKVALEWNLANDPFFRPHTPGGCTQCKGAITINGSAVTRNVSYYIVAHMSKFITPGSQRVQSNAPGNFSQVAFKTPEGKYVLVAMNEGNLPVKFNIRWQQKYAAAELPGGTVATYIW